MAAGADAVYLGGRRFNARAYAGNFSDEELIEAIRFAHLRGCRIYLTLNTLIKEREFDELTDYLRPLDAALLDGVIVQDPGVLSLIRERFPALPVHASTQMAVTGAYGVSWLAGRGVRRVVPARELSLTEMAEIKKRTGERVELEAFIHGAMCYSYSGMCLMSAMLGGRSGNRGRCAGACRLSYDDGYPLSLRDMCTLPVLDRLIAPGTGAAYGLKGPVIDSLKIEGRMKDPVYTAGVTAVYRAAIDRIYAAPEEPYRPGKREMETLRGLYLRSELCEGYYFSHNGADMITGDSPGYTGSDESVTESVRERFLGEPSRVPVQVRLRAVTGEPVRLSLSAGGLETEVTGPETQRAEKHPADAESLKRQLDRFGGSSFVPEEIEVICGENGFVPASVLNDLRRDACGRLTERILSAWERAS